jgi:hypothetical protein
LLVRLSLAIVTAIAFAVVQIGVVAAAPSRQPKVVVISGPAEAKSEMHRNSARASAREARRWTNNVIEILSPNATWPRVRKALQGASIVVYTGHGNGWPSKYRPTPYPVTQNGLGLNPVEGGGDNAHQYFGEAYLVKHIRLAPGAVVILNHLCYASGNSEPGLPEGTLDVARQRVDNYAAGWLRTGARAVVAEGYISGVHYLRGLLTTKQSIGQIWRNSPKYRGNVMSFQSVRTPGAQLMLDPDRPRSGYYRSIAGDLGLKASEVLASAPRAASPQAPISQTPVAPPEPQLGEQLVAAGFRFEAPELQGSGVAAAETMIRLPMTVPTGKQLPEKLSVGYRWEPLEPDPPAGDPPTRASVTGGEAADKGEYTLALTPASLVATSIVAHVRLPTAAGRYRLVVTVHDEDDVALGANGESLVPELLVHVATPGGPSRTMPWEELDGSVTGTDARLPIEQVGGR